SQPGRGHDRDTRCMNRPAIRGIEPMSCFLPSVVLVTTAAVASGGCRVSTEYVPQTPGKATLGVESDQIGVYKNGAFTKLSDDFSRTFECSARASATASAATERGRSYWINGWIGLGGF